MRRCTAPFAVACFSVAGLLLAVSPVAADEPIVRVEEDWEMVLLNPDPANDAPQVTCVTSPVGNLSGMYMIFELNHRTQSSYAKGGTQLQIWNGPSLHVHRNGPNFGQLVHSGEIVRWTQRMTLDGATLEFAIVNGTSASWGNFGGQGYLRDSIETSLTDLNAYSPDVSVNHSGVGFASNRVASLVLKEVRYYSATGMVAQDTQMRPAHQQVD